MGSLVAHRVSKLSSKATWLIGGLGGVGTVASVGGVAKKALATSSPDKEEETKKTEYKEEETKKTEYKEEETKKTEYKANHLFQDVIDVLPKDAEKLHAIVGIGRCAHSARIDGSKLQQDKLGDLKPTESQGWYVYSTPLRSSLAEEDKLGSASVLDAITGRSLVDFQAGFFIGYQKVGESEWKFLYKRAGLKDEFFARTGSLNGKEHLMDDYRDQSGLDGVILEEFKKATRGY